MVLQVPWGPELPSHLQTTTYQAQVLNKGSMPMLGRHSSVANSSADDLARTSSVGPSPLKSVLGRISRTFGGDADGSGAGSHGDHPEGTRFLQRALASMRAEGGGSGAAVAPARSRLLKTVPESAAIAGTPSLTGAHAPLPVPARALLPQRPAAAGAAAAGGTAPTGDIEMGGPQAAAPAQVPPAMAAVATEGNGLERSGPSDVTRRGIAALRERAERRGGAGRPEDIQIQLKRGSFGRASMT